MGLDIIVYKPAMSFRAGSYSGFHEWRTWLAQKEGINLMEMEGFDGDRSWDDIVSPLKPLLSHSDCDGFLDWADCMDMLPRLREIWNEGTVTPPEEGVERSVLTHVPVIDEESSWYLDVLNEWINAIEDIKVSGGMLVFA